MKGNFKQINVYYKSLVRLLDEKKYIGIVNEWVVDNYHIVIEVKNFVAEFFATRSHRHNFKKYGDKTVAMISNILEGNQYNVDYDGITREIVKYQRKSDTVISYIELGLVKPIIIGLLINEITRICETEKSQTDEHPEGEWADLINENTKRHLKVENIFRLLKQSITYVDSKTVAAVSLTEKELNRDREYAQMQEKTKQEYRIRILKHCKRAKQSEIEFAKSLVERGATEQTHIGFYLFRHPHYRVRMFVYLFMVSALTVGITMFAARWLSHWYVLAFATLLIPTSELVIRYVNKIFHKIYRPHVLPKMDYMNGIPVECATIAVIPTIVRDTEKLDRMFQNLERYYLVNRSANLYFTLLADASEEKTEKCPHDDVVRNHGLKCCERLNEKYGANIFHFAYRRRRFVKSENSYIGWERKRGALLQFNRLVLKTLGVEEIQKGFYCETLSSIKQPIRYAITLDSESELIVGSVFGLVSTMAHPLNRPIVDERARRVISGYAIMQPKVAIATESAQKSPYVKLFGGSESFDPYNPVIANFYQDVFGEGSFMGKGIYDLAVFDQILYNRFMDSRILSHDLIESNYLRSAQIADVEIIDDFPSRFLSDMSRHHRWARGDTQALPWLFPHIKNRAGKREKNPSSALGKWKIFDNLRRMFLDVSVLGVTFLALATTNVWQSLWLILVFAIFSAGLFGSLAKFPQNLARTLINFCLVPFRVAMYLGAFARSMWRLCISKKHLLKWRTSEDADRGQKNTLASYILGFKFTYVVIIALLGLVAWVNPINLIAGGIIATMWFSAPFVLFATSRTNRTVREKLNPAEEAELHEIARRTWKYFEDNLTAQNHYLVPDNFQVNREYQVDYKTSATNIGLSLTSVVCAYRLDLITRAKCLDLIENIVHTICVLPKWNGHLFNFYNIREFAPMWPQFVSSVDSGNLVACLITIKEFLIAEGQKELAQTVTDLIWKTDFRVFYNNDLGVFSIGYNKAEGEFSTYNYNKFASESRILSYVAIIKGDVPVKHWFYLDKTLTKHKGHKGLASWSGSLFEYFMPTVFMKTYPGTIIDESCEFAYFCQRDYMKKVGETLPWGISECAFDSLDGGVNYRYKVFSVPYLKLNQGKETRVVISPYSSCLVLPRKPKTVLANLRRLKGLDMFAEYGFYESYDAETKNPVLAYFAHHQGLILASIANTLRDGMVQNLFEQNPSAAAYTILNKEIMQKRPAIDLKMEKYKKLTYSKESVNNNVHTLNQINPLPEYAVISNGNMTTLLDDRGRGYTAYNNIQLNRYRKITNTDYGTFMYLRDVQSGHLWSSTYAPINRAPSGYEVVYAFDKVKYLLTENDIITNTEVIIANNTTAELRKFTLRNLSRNDKEIEYTTYLEPTICDNSGDVGHKTFSNLFMTVRFDEKSNSLVMKRNRRSSKTNYYMAHSVFSPNSVDAVNSFETLRENFINADGVLPEKLSNTIGTPIDPCMGQRNRVIVPKGESVTIYMVNAFAASRDQALKIVEGFNTPAKFAKEFNAVSIANIYNTKAIDLKGGEVALYNAVINRLFQVGSMAIDPKRQELLQKNYHTQETLWRFSISGDMPYIFVPIDGIESVAVVKNVLKVFEFCKTRGVSFDVVIVYNSAYVEQIVRQELIRIDMLHKFENAGRVVCIDGKDVTPKERHLLETAASMVAPVNDGVTLANIIDRFNTQKVPYQSPKVPQKTPLTPQKSPQNTPIFTHGFNKSGDEYHISGNPPAPWCNVLSNQNFGSVVTNVGGGFTFAYNSNEFKISSWTGDITNLAPSEGFIIDNKPFVSTDCVHGRGFSIFNSNDADFDRELTQFVANDDNVKVFKLKLHNKTAENAKLPITFWVNAVLGHNEEKTATYVLTEFDPELDCLVLRNVYHPSYSDVKVFLNSSASVVEYHRDHVLQKSITVNVDVPKNTEREVTFTIGAYRDSAEMDRIVNKYKDLATAHSELLRVTKEWHNRLDQIHVETPDNGFNLMVNGWLLYQALSARLYAKAGYYQVSGAFGFRDQLQDSVNVVTLFPEITKNQILENARHQFLEGDVLHWWLKNKNFGQRSRYRDDALWLVYAVNEYIRATDDYRILKIDVPFIEAPALMDYEEEKGVSYTYTNFSRPLAEHLKIIIEAALADLGEHGLPRMWGGDWNDGMNAIGIKGRGESVWLGFFLYDNLGRFIDMAKTYNLRDPEKIAGYERAREALKEALNTAGWGGEYYLRAYHDDGNKIGAPENPECAIDLLCQSFAILTNVADHDRTKSILKHVRENLVDDKNKIVKLINPPFKLSPSYPGYIQDYPPGIRENGGQYTHSVAWYIEALAKSGDRAGAYETFCNVNPVNRTKTPADVAKYRTEPYVIVADIYSNWGNEGRGGWTWYTGSAGWFYRVAIETILGIQKHGEKLLIANPCVPWDKFTVTYKYMETTYEIQYVAGKKPAPAEIPLVNDGKTHRIVVNYCQ